MTIEKRSKINKIRLLKENVLYSEKNSLKKLTKELTTICQRRQINVWIKMAIQQFKLTSIMGGKS